MDSHEGEALGKYLKTKRVSVPKFADAIGVTKQAVYAQIDKDRLADSFIIKIKESAFADFVDVLNHQSASKPNDKEKSNQGISQLLNAYEKALESERLLNELLRQNLETANETIAELKARLNEQKHKQKTT